VAASGLEGIRSVKGSCAASMLEIALPSRAITARTKKCNAVLCLPFCLAQRGAEDFFYAIFDGKTFQGWEERDVFRIEEGKVIAATSKTKWHATSSSAPHGNTPISSCG